MGKTGTMLVHPTWGGNGFSTRHLLAQKWDSEIERVGVGKERGGVRPSWPGPRKSGLALERRGRGILASYTTTSSLCLRSHGFRGKQGRGVICTAYAAYFMGVCPKAEAVSLSCGVGRVRRRRLRKKRWACLASEGSKHCLASREAQRKRVTSFFAHSFPPHTIKAHTHRHGVHAGSHFNLRPFRSSPGLDSVVPCSRILNARMLLLAACHHQGFQPRHTRTHVATRS